MNPYQSSKVATITIFSQSNVSVPLGFFSISQNLSRQMTPLKELTSATICCILLIYNSRLSLSYFQVTMQLILQLKTKSKLLSSNNAESHFHNLIHLCFLYSKFCTIPNLYHTCIVCFTNKEMNYKPENHCTKTSMAKPPFRS